MLGNRSLIAGLLLLAAGCASGPRGETATAAAASAPGAAYAAALQPCPALTPAQSNRLVAEHVYGGAPAGGPLLVRRAYVTQYDAARRNPRWAAWRYTHAYSNTPEREGIWKTFRTDRAVSNPVANADYDGAGYDRGHIAPYFISGGDRDGDGALASKKDLSLLDIDDACSVFEINFMSNITPQLVTLNRSGGSWFKLEAAIRDLVDQGADLHMFAGAIYDSTPLYMGPQRDIDIPDQYFQIVVLDDVTAVAFLFPHTKQPAAGGACQTGAEPADCITSVDEIERLTGLDFFPGLPPACAAAMKRRRSVDAWKAATQE